MSKNSKKRKQERKQKRQEFHLKQDVDKLPDESKTNQINQTSAIKPEMPDYDDELKENFLISFVHYKSSECGMGKLVDGSARQLVKVLKKLNSTKRKDLPNSRLIRDSVNNSGDYSKLYNGLSPDVEIKEIDFSDTGRIFAYFVRRYVCIVAINPVHKNTH